MRIGECVDLSIDCLRPLGPNQRAIHVPLGKLKTERWVPVDAMVCQLVERIRSLRPSTAPNTGRLLLPRPRGRYMLIRRLRAALQQVVSTVGITARIVPHQFRHTYGTEMLRAGVSFAAVIKLLGHKSPHMTLEYLEITQQDLQREFLGALPSQTPGAISDHLLWLPTSCGFDEPDRLFNRPPSTFWRCTAVAFPTTPRAAFSIVLPIASSRSSNPQRNQETQPARRMGIRPVKSK